MENKFCVVKVGLQWYRRDRSDEGGLLPATFMFAWCHTSCGFRFSTSGQCHTSCSFQDSSTSGECHTPCGIGFQHARAMSHILWFQIPARQGNVTHLVVSDSSTSGQCHTSCGIRFQHIRAMSHILWFQIPARQGNVHPSQSVTQLGS